MIGLMPIQGIAWAGDEMANANDDSNAKAGTLAVAPLGLMDGLTPAGDGDSPNMTYKLQFFDYNGSALAQVPTEMQSNPPFLFAYLVSKESGKVVGWNCTQFATGDSAGALSATVPNKFSKYAYYGEDTSIDFDSDEYTLKTRVIRDGKATAGVFFGNFPADDNPSWGEEAQLRGYSFMSDESTPNVFKLKKDYVKMLAVELSYINGDSGEQAAPATIIVRGEATTTGLHYAKISIPEIQYSSTPTEYQIAEWFRINNGNVQSTGNDYSDAWQNVEAFLFAGNVSLSDAIARLQGGDQGLPYLAGYLLGKHDRESRAGGFNQETGIQTITLPVTLDGTPLESALTPEQVLGDAHEFGIVADKYLQHGHTETNFAVKTFEITGGDANQPQNLDIDGSGSAPIPFYAGKVESGMRFGAGQNVDACVYITKEDYETHTFKQDSSNHAVHYIFKSREYINDYVDGLISSAQSTSQDLLQKTTVTPVPNGDDKLNLDTTAYPDNTTIYVDCTNIMDRIRTGATGGAPLITKLPGQTIVFNIPASGHVEIGQFYVKVKGTPDIEIDSTTSANNGDPARNQLVDNVILSHIVFNVANASSVDTNNASALFLAPQAEKFTQSNGAGWIVCKGTVDSNAEWHFYRHTREFNPYATYVPKVNKQVSGSGMPGGEIFSFTLEKYTKDGESRPESDKLGTGTTSVSAGQTASFEAVTFVEAGTYYYVIKEIEPDNKTDGMTYDTTPKYLKVVVTGSIEEESLKIDSVGYGSSADACNAASLTVTNEYKAPGSADELRATKHVDVVDGKGTQKTISEGQFKFKIERTFAEPADGIEESLTREPSNNANGNVSFGSIKFTKAGTYVYKITETSESSNGYTKDASVYTVTYTVDSSLNVTKTVRKGEGDSAQVVPTGAIDFANTYSAAPTDLTLTGTKNLVDANNKEIALGNKAFHFTVTEDEHNPSDGAVKSLEADPKNDSSGHITFGTIAYSKPGTWNYTIKEEASDSYPGIFCDPTVHKVQVEVKDDGKGQLYTHVNYDAVDKDEQGISINFTNKLLSTTAKLQVGKTVSGDTTSSAYNPNLEYEFGLSKCDASTNETLPENVTAKTTAGNNAEFGDITYTEPGTYYYTIKENEPNDKPTGMSYDKNNVYAKVVVERNGSNLVSSITYSTEQENEVANKDYTQGIPAFTNTFTKPTADSVEVELKGSKKINGGAPEASLSNNKTFSFKIEPNADNGEGVDQTRLNKTPKSTAQGVIDFGKLTFHKVGTYAYTVTETSEGGNGITKDPAVFTITYTVTEKEDHTLDVVRSITKNSGGTTSNPDTIEFNNTYESAPAEVTFTGTKTLLGGSLADKQFTFELDGTTANTTSTEPASTKLDATNAANGSIVLSDSNNVAAIKFNEPGTYEYTAKETSQSKPGIECDSKTHKVIVEVKDNGAGQLVAKVKVDETAVNEQASATVEAAGLGYTNTVLTGQVVLGVSKTVRGNTERADYNGDETFTFELAKAAVGEHSRPSTDTLPSEESAKKVTAKANENDQFGAITYIEAGTYYYSISESSGSTVGMTYAAPQYVKVVVERNNVDGEPTLKATSVTYAATLDELWDDAADPSATGDTPTIPMVNTYAKTTYKPSVTKNYVSDNGTTAPSETFNFSLGYTPADGQIVPEGGASASIQMNAAGTQSADFGEITYTKPGTYAYTISESAGTTHGTQYSTSTVAVTVKVTADDNGALKAEATISGGGGDNHEIVNTHGHDADSVMATMLGRKTVNGQNPGAGKQFTFTAEHAQGDWTKVDESKLNLGDKQSQNDANGQINFGSILFKEPGTWSYTVRELGEDGNGMTLDKSEYTVTYTVEWDNKGTDDTSDDVLKVTPAYTKSGVDGAVDGILFNNVYDVTPATVDLSGKKTLTGGVLSENQFSFELVDAENHVVQTKANTEGGTYAFDQLSFTAEGTYTYTVREKDGVAADIERDASTYSVSIFVKDNGQGRLEATPTITKNPGNVTTYATRLDFANVRLHGSAKLAVAKNFDSAYAGSKPFTFTLERVSGVENGDKLPNVLTATAEKATDITGESAYKPAVFGDIEFSKVGDYVYKITEQQPESTEGVTYSLNPTYAKVHVHRVTPSEATGDTLQADVTYGASSESCNASTWTVTNKVAAPAIEKYVNKNVHADLPTFDTGFTYDILAYVTSDADVVEVIDQLVDGIAFGCEAKDVKVVDLGAEVDHAVNGSVARDGSAVNADAKIDGKTLAVTIGDATALRGHWVKVTYQAKLDNDVIATYEQYESNDEDITTNGPVTEGPEHHDGVPNTASYKVFVKQSGGTTPEQPTYEKKSNTVTVTPATTQVSVSKQWKDASGKDLGWPAGTSVTIELLRDGKSLDPAVTTKLTPDKTSDTFSNLPVYTGKAYTVKETAISGTNAAFATTITPNETHDSFVVTNKRLEGSATLSVKKAVEGGLGWDTNEEFEFKLTDSDNNNNLIETVKLKAGEAKEFASISYTEPGTHNYAITEVEPTNKTENMTYDTNPRYVKVEVSPNESNDALQAKVTYSTDGETYVEGTPVVANVYTAPAIEKYVNKDVHADLAAFNTGFTYDILAYVTSDADKVEVVDQLVSGITFAGTANDVTVVDLGTEVDHQVNGSVAKDGTAITNVQKAINVKTLTVTINDASALRGHWIKVTYPAKLDNGIVDTWSSYENNKRAIAGNENSPVLTDAPHEGVPNTASYKVFVKQSDGTMPTAPKYEKPSNTVTVTPAIMQVGVTKEWKNEDGASLDWPDGASVTVALVRTENGVSSKTNNERVLTKDSQTATFENLPVFEGVTYSVTETATMGVPEGYVATVTDGAENNFTITNKLTRVSISKVDVNGGAELAGATIQILKGDVVVKEWVSTDKPEIVEGLAPNTTYTLREKVAPEGYSIASDTTFRLDADGKVDASSVTTKYENGILLIEDTLLTDASATISVAKQVQANVVWNTDEDFTFELAKEDGTVVGAATTKAGKTASFDPIAFNKAGEYFFTITEKAGTTKDLTYDLVPKWVKVTVTQNQEKKCFDAVVTYGKTRDTCTDSTLTVANIYAVPALEKYINKDVHQNLPAFDTPFTYDILAFVTKDADKVVIRDSLVKGVNFNCKPEEVKVEDIGPDNDHTAHSTVENATKFKDEKGNEIDVKADVELDGKNLTVTIPDASVHRGHWVRVTYNVRLDNSVVSNSSEYIDNDNDVKANGTVISKDYPTHDGVDTTASYEVFVYQRDANGNVVTESDGNGGQVPVLSHTYPLNANVITVTPPTVTIPVSKTWTDADGKQIEWPKDATVTVELLGKVDGEAMSLDKATAKVLGADKAVEAQTITLTADKTSDSFANLPVYEAIEYTVVEANVTGAPEGFTTTITGDNSAGYTITNAYEAKPTTPVESKKTTPEESSSSSTTSEKSSSTASSSSTTAEKPSSTSSSTSSSKASSSKTTSKASSTSKSGLAKTGDPIPVVLLVALVALGALGVGVSILRRRRD